MLSDKTAIRCSPSQEWVLVEVSSPSPEQLDLSSHSVDARTRRDRITEDSIAQLVDTFYAKVRADVVLGPIFEQAIDDWEPHLATMRDFWSSLALTSGRYKGNPLAVHRRIEGIEPALFDRWLKLFDDTCSELFVSDIAVAFGEKAARIAESFKLGLFYRPDRTWPPRAP